MTTPGTPATARQAAEPDAGRRRVDVLVIGAGVAGLSAAAEIARFASVAVLEAERTIAYHTSGRSAAVFITNYGNELTQELTAASRPWYDGRAEGASEYELLRPRGGLIVAAHGEDIAPQGLHLASAARSLSVKQACEAWPALRPDVVASAWSLPTDFLLDLDVGETLTAWRRLARGRGATITTSCPVVALEPDSSGWTITTGRSATLDTWHASIIVNAAGAWADSVARLAGLDALGIVPLRRTALTFLAGDIGHEQWPMLVGAAGDLYVKPEPGLFLASPVDEIPSEPVDAKPEEIDLARTLDRVRELTTLAARTLRTAWAGLRSFAPDRSLVIGADPRQERFLWCAGQGGYGFQCAPAAAALTAKAAAAALQRRIPTTLSARTTDSIGQLLRPDRLIP